MQSCNPAVISYNPCSHILQYCSHIL
jgi:hypothetical protein